MALGWRVAQDLKLVLLRMTIAVMGLGWGLRLPSAPRASSGYASFLWLLGDHPLDPSAPRW